MKLGRVYKQLIKESLEEVECNYQIGHKIPKLKCNYKI